MAGRTQFSARVCLGLLLPLLQIAAFAQQEATTADQVITNYLEAIGSDHFSSIQTLVEIGDLSSMVIPTGGSAYGATPFEQHGTFEFFFKSPNLRFGSMITADNRVISLRGCDGKLAWSIDASLTRRILQPKPGADECEQGLKPELSRARLSGITLRLLKKKQINGRPAWGVKIEDPKRPQTVYFDAETFFLLRKQEVGSSITFSDYRNVGQIMIPFTVIAEGRNFKQVNTVREIKINAPLDDARFVEPKVEGNTVVNRPMASAVEDHKVHAENSSPAATPDTESPDVSSPPPPITATAATAVEVNFPNFTSCAMPALHEAVPELKGLQPASNQEELATLLEKVGAKTLDIARNTPNLIARERVSEPLDASKTHRDYDYLILARPQGSAVTLDEFRLDLKSGAKFQSDDMIRETSHQSDSEPAGKELANSRIPRPPMSQGFATSWVHFYPSNRARATYRYLGEERVGGHRMLVLAFAQKPASVPMPAIFQYEGKTTPIFLQGIAWIDPSDFRILRLRTDLLSPVPELSLHRFTADIQFGPARIGRMASLLQLPTKVTVTTAIGGSFRQEIHEYSEYRLFRAQSRVIPMP